MVAEKIAEWWRSRDAARCRNLDAKLASAKTEIASLADALERSLDRNGNYSETISQLREELDNVRQSLADSQHEKDLLEARVQIQQSEIEQLSLVVTRDRERVQSELARYAAKRMRHLREEQGTNLQERDEPWQ